MNPILLGQAATRFGLADALAQPQQQQRRVVGDDPKRREYGASARNYGLAEALQPISVESGTWGEALAEALAGGLRGRAAQSERQQGVETELWDRNQAEKTQGARNSAISEALAGFDPANPTAMVGALSQGAPEEALGLATQLMGRTGERWSQPYSLNGATVQENLATGEVRQAVPRAPVGRSASTGSPELPSGFVWE